MALESVHRSEKLSHINEQGSPKVVAAGNDGCVTIVKCAGEFAWHHHDDEDEMFFVVPRRLRMHFCDREVSLLPDEFIIVPKSVEQGGTEEEVHGVLIEPNTTLNTGNVRNERSRVELQRHSTEKLFNHSSSAGCRAKQSRFISQARRQKALSFISRAPLATPESGAT
jgi:mannose-6-phosphate isomerase-like protein (cupin superfamily)